MLYVVGNKTYLATFDTTKKMYPEVKIYKNIEGNLQTELTGKGLAKKPSSRTICTLKEFLAQKGQDLEVSKD